MNAIEANILITKMSHYWPMFKPDPDMAETWAHALEKATLADAIEALKGYSLRDRRPATVADIAEWVRSIEAKRFSALVRIGRDAVEARYEEHYNLTYRFENSTYAAIGEKVKEGMDPEPVFAEWERQQEAMGYTWTRKEIAA